MLALAAMAEPIARNALLLSLALCGGLGLLAMRPVVISPPDAPARAADEPGQPEVQSAAMVSMIGLDPRAVLGQVAAEGDAPAASNTVAGRLAPLADAILKRRPAPRREPFALTEAQRGAGLNECMTPDPGRGYFAEPRTMWRGMAHIPARGGHTDDGGYDVIMHFHGGPAARKALVGAAHGVAFIGIDLGTGSAAYSQPFGSSALLFDELRHSVEKALRAQSNRPDAHIRHLAIGGWSAGYGAVNSILRHAGPGPIDAVYLLDGFHSSYLPSDGSRTIDAQNVAPITDYARLATRDERFFFLTHSQIGTEGYASTTEMSDLLLRQLGLPRMAGEPSDDPLGLRTFVDHEGFHLRGFGGMDERAHCDHLRHLAEAVRLLEERWNTPAATAP